MVVTFLKYILIFMFSLKKFFVIQYNLIKNNEYQFFSKKNFLPHVYIKYFKYQKLINFIQIRNYCLKACFFEKKRIDFYAICIE